MEQDNLLAEARRRMEAILSLGIWVPQVTGQVGLSKDFSLVLLLVAAVGDRASL